MEINPPTKTDAAAADPAAKTANGVTPPAADAATTDSKTVEKPAVPQGKFKPLIKKFLPIVVIFILIVGAGFIGYTLGKKSGQAQKSAQVTVAQAQAPTTSDATKSAEVTAKPSPVPPTCISGYKPFINDLFSICYPNSMSAKETEEQASGSARANSSIVYTFSDDVEVLKVNPDFKDNLNKFDCATSKVVKVSGFSAQRYLIKDSSKTGGCSQTLASFGTLVSAGGDKPVFYIGLSKKSGSYQSDNNSFTTIEQSFKINQ